MALTQDSTKYWAPVQQVVDYISNKVIQPNDWVLEIGPGHAPFKRANVSVDFVDVPGVQNLIKCDVANEPLPFQDKEFDFVYCRHTLEDMYNPFPLIKEMSRVAKRGYIEVPSPMAEIGRGVDGGSPPFRGYHHHRWVGWVFGREFRMVSKYAYIEYCRFDEATIDALLKQERYWNSFYLWEGEIVVNHIQSPLNFSIPRDYVKVLSDAVERSKENTDLFFANMGIYK
jgi:hypothetical protein